MILISYINYKGSQKLVIIKHIQKDSITTYQTTVGRMKHQNSTISFVDIQNKDRTVILHGNFIVEYPDGR